MPLRALIFDFDGLILDTETPDLQAWEEIYTEYGQQFPVAEWGQIVGGDGRGPFDPIDHLESLLGYRLGRSELRSRHRRRDYELIAANTTLPGVVDLLDQASGAGLGLAIASSSPFNWVHSHLTRLELDERFEHLVTADDVEQTKPNPSLFLTACERLGVAPAEAVVLEDSPNGILAARRAGIYCVAVPNSVTRRLDLGSPDLLLDSLEQLRLDQLPLAP